MPDNAIYPIPSTTIPIPNITITTAQSEPSLINIHVDTTFYNSTTSPTYNTTLSGNQSEPNLN